MYTVTYLWLGKPTVTFQTADKVAAESVRKHLEANGLKATVKKG